MSNKNIFAAFLSVIVLSWFTDSAQAAAISAENCNRDKCPWKLWSHYIEKGCEPIYDAKECCPTKFKCPQYQNPSEKGCLQAGVLYPTGSSVNLTNPCSKCYCRVAGGSFYPRINCMHIECSEQFIPVDKNCVLIYKENECCSIKTHCDNGDTTSPAPMCSYGNRTYLEGEYVDTIEDPCQACYCKKGFRGSHGPGCRRVDDCYVEYGEQLANGCTPVFHVDACCPIDWLCPETGLHSITESNGNRCHFDGQTYPRGAKLPLNKDCVSCRCKTPPEFTCVQNNC